jgi:isoprenylcysteine carboxyl methyltransferase (ICMT) family protein YpbQ
MKIGLVQVTLKGLFVSRGHNINMTKEEEDTLIKHGAYEISKKTGRTSVSTHCSFLPSVLLANHTFSFVFRHDRK